MKIVTHDGKFHSDDVFGGGLLKLIYPDVNITRTRDKEQIDLADIVFDVGLELDSSKSRYDHHQFKKDQLTRLNGISYSSFGLLWNQFSRKLGIDTKGLQKIDRKLVQIIDAHDNMQDLGVKNPRYSVTNFTSLFNDFGSYNEAVEYASWIIQAEIGNLEGELPQNGAFAYRAALKNLFDVKDDFKTLKEIWRMGELSRDVKKELKNGIMKPVFRFDKEMAYEQRDYPMIQAVNAVAVDNFGRAVEMAYKNLQMEILSTSQKLDDRRSLKELFTNANSYVVLDKEYNEWREFAMKSNALFVVYPSKGSYRVQCAPSQLTPEVLKKPFPAEWGGKEGVDLQEVSGYKDLQFCHSNRHVAKTNTLDGAVELAEKYSKKV